jgi:hypothetical protein
MSFLNITGVDLADLAKAAYRFSRPQGMGFLHYTDGDLSDEDARTIVDRERADGRVALSMDYVNGRACKMVVWRINGQLFIMDKWFDHSPEDLTDLLAVVGKADAELVEQLPEPAATI